MAIFNSKLLVYQRVHFDSYRNSRGLSCTSPAIYVLGVVIIALSAIPAVMRNSISVPIYLPLGSLRVAASRGVRRCGGFIYQGTYRYDD